jgi:hypothetical protein
LNYTVGAEQQTTKSIPPVFPRLKFGGTPSGETPTRRGGTSELPQRLLRK